MERIFVNSASHLALAVATALVVSACNGAESHTANSPRRPQADQASASPVVEQPVGALSDASNDAETGSTAVEKTCGSSTFLVIRGKQGSANETELIRRDASGTTFLVDKPKEMQGYTAVGLGCATARDGASYAVVQYGELPFGCKFCEWFYLYDLQGKQLNTSDPPILSDANLPHGEGKTSNTRGYEEVIQRLGIVHPDMTLVR